MSADLRLAAWFLWMMPLAAAMSIFLAASRTASAVVSAPVSAALLAFLTRVLISERAALLRRRAFSFCLLRLIWLLMFAMESTRLAGALSRPPGRRHRPADPYDAAPCQGLPSPSAPSRHRGGRSRRSRRVAAPSSRLSKPPGSSGSDR